MKITRLVGIAYLFFMVTLLALIGVLWTGSILGYLLFSIPAWLLSCTVIYRIGKTKG
jgi:hypothetical protein